MGPRIARPPERLAEDPDLRASVDRTLLAHAERNERVLAVLRAVTMTAVASLDAASFLRVADPGVTVGAALPIVSAVGAAVSWAFVAILARGGYRRWMQIAVPVVEGAFLAAAFGNSLRSLGVEAFRDSGSLAALALICALFALSGALRLNRWAIAITAAIAIAVFAGFAARMVPTPVLGIGLSALAAIGALTYVLTGSVRAAVQSEIARGTLRRFLPSHVVDRAHDDPARLLTEPRGVEATVVFTDIRGFTAWAERRSPEEVLARLNELQGALAGHVQAHGGTVDKFMGDGMLAVFGAPEPLADHADRALAAVRAMRAVADDELAIGIGVHSGPLVVGCLGKGLRLEFTVIGDTVNTASRLEALTKAHGVDVLVSEASRERLGGAPGLVPLGETAIRGRQEPLRIYTLGD